MGSLGRVGDGVGSEERSHALLNGEGDSLVVVAEEEHGVNLVPRLVGDDVFEDRSGLVLQLLNGLLLGLGLDIVVENLLGGLSMNVVALRLVSIKASQT